MSANSAALNAPAHVKHAKLLAWVQEMVDLTQPRDVVWCDGSEAEYDRLCARMVEASVFLGTLKSTRSNIFKLFKFLFLSNLLNNFIW